MNGPEDLRIVSEASEDGKHVCELLVGFFTIVRGENNYEILLVSWYWYDFSMNVGATKVYTGSVRVGPK
jgi:hypothetical protein